MTADYTRPARFRIGRVLRDSFSVFRRNALLCIGLGLLFSAIPTFLHEWWIAKSVGSTEPELVQAATIGLNLIIIFLLSPIMDAALCRAAIEDLNGIRPRFGACLGMAISMFFPIMGITLLTTLGVSIGFALLIVPGIVLALRWLVTVPVLVSEKCGVSGSMSRSTELTEGSRWPLLALLFIGIVVIAAVAVSSELALMLLGPKFGAVGTVSAAGLSSVLSALAEIAFSLVSTVAYVELRLIRDGTDINDLAEIFA